MNIKTFMALAVVALTAACNSKDPSALENQVIADEINAAEAIEQGPKGDDKPKGIK